MLPRRFFIHCLKRSDLPLSYSKRFKSSGSASTFNSLLNLFSDSICFTSAFTFFCSSLYFFRFSVRSFSSCCDNHSAFDLIWLKVSFDFKRSWLDFLIGARSSPYFQRL